jgi:putative ABC transport system permease protein
VRLRNVAHLYRVRLRARLVAELLALAGIAVGVALVFAALVANTSLTGSVRQLNEGVVGDASIQLAARGPDGFDQGIAGRVMQIAGVSSAAPIVESRINLVGPGGLRSVLLVGGDPRFARFGGRLLQGLAAGRRGAEPGLALPAPLAAELGVEVGEKVTVETGAGVARARVAGLLRNADVGSLVKSPVALAPLPLAQALSGMQGRVSRVFVDPRPGRDRVVREALSRIAPNRLDVGPADREVAIFERAAYPTNQSTTLFSVLSALVGFLFAFSAMLLTVPQRRLFISELRLAGYEPWVVVQLLLIDALVLGLAGSIFGLVLGDQVSRLLFDSPPNYLLSAFPIGAQRIVTWQTVALAGVAGVVAACVAVLAPVRDALTTGPAQPVAVGAAPSRGGRLTIAGAACMALTAAIVVLAPQAALAGIGTLTLALLLLLPLLLRLSTAGFDLLGRRARGPVAILAVLELRSGVARIRTLALAATGAVAVFATVSIGGAHADLQRGLDAATRDSDQGADVWVTFRGAANVFATARITVPPAKLEAVRRLSGVREVHVYRGALLDVGAYRAWVKAQPPMTRQLIPESQIRQGDLDLAIARVRRGGWLALYEGIAEELGVGVGDRLRLPSPLPTEFRVAALTTNGGWPGGAIFMNAADFARAWGNDAASALGIEIDPGASPVVAAQSVRRALGPGLPLRVETRGERIRHHRESSRAGLSRLTQISALVLASAILAMAAAMGGMIWQRRATLAALKVHGFPEGELWRSLLLESGLLLGTGCLIGAAFGLLGQVLLDRALEEITGFPVEYAMAGRIAAGVLALITGAAVAMLAIPGWLAVRVRPMAGIQV